MSNYRFLSPIAALNRLSEAETLIVATPGDAFRERIQAMSGSRQSDNRLASVIDEKSMASSLSSSVSDSGRDQAQIANKQIEQAERWLERHWAWARFAARWRLYRSGYHLHARGTWRRAHPHLREYQIRTHANEMRYLVNEEFPEQQQAVFDADESMNVTVEELEDLSREFKAKLQAELKRREELGQEVTGSTGSALPRSAPTRSQKSSTASSASATPKAAPSAATLAANQATGEVSPLTGRQLDQIHDAEAKILAARAQEIGLIARTALLGLLTGDDSAAMAFQDRQVQALCDELAPPGSRIEERLLAEVIANARFESLLWQARSAEMIATGKREHVTHLGPRARLTTPVGAIVDQRAAKAERRYMQALRDLIQLRRALGPGVQVNVANLIGEAPSQSPSHTHSTVLPIDAVPPIDQASDS